MFDALKARIGQRSECTCLAMAVVSVSRSPDAMMLLPVGTLAATAGDINSWRIADELAPFGVGATADATPLSAAAAAVDTDSAFGVGLARSRNDSAAPLSAAGVAAAAAPEAGTGGSGVFECN